MNVQFLLVGQGICGTFLSWNLRKAGVSFLVIDNHQASTASRIAAGIINPVTGRRLVKAWMIDELIPFIKQEYEAFGKTLGNTAISQQNIIEFFPNPFMRESFLKRLEEENSYLELPGNDTLYSEQFQYEFGYGIIQPAFTVHLETILPAWRKKLKENNNLLEEDPDASELKIGENETRYKDIRAAKIIFCDGIASARNPLFRNLPFAFNKGEALVIEAADLPVKNIYKKGIMLAPLQQPGCFWVGSNYLWEYENDSPSEGFRTETEKQLYSWLKIPFRVVDHLAAIRPATVERRPFVGMHPLNKNVGILNGMGTKGCSLAPFFAKQLAGHLLHQTPIMPEADVRRYKKILSGSRMI